ncbi:MAG TPA: LysR family transcriptional regulator, partial [Ktedonobacterales bacterium]|nr:LysR family transcriptional regulator [Ktedonobacterales bacterium]
MDLSQLIAFERIVREGNFSRAARTLDIAQPTISARIQALEEEVGGPLFLRGGRVIALTERGQSFLPYAQHVIRVLAEGVETARLTQTGERGRVTVAAIPSLAGSFLAATIVRFRQTHPQVDLLVKVGASKQIMAQLADGIVTLGLISWPYFYPDVRPLLRFRESLKLMVSASHPLAGRESVTLEEVQRAGVPVFEVKLWVSIDPALAQLTAQAQPLIDVPLDTARHLLLRGLGAALLTPLLVAEELAAGRVVALSISDAPPSFR